MENFYFKSFCTFALVISVLRKSVSSSSLEDGSIAKNGDLILGALFPLYRKDSNGDCTVVNKDGLLWVKALNFALDELKSSKNPWLRNVTFGLYLRDTCSRPALEHSLDILHLNKQSNSLKETSSKKVVAVLTNSNDIDSSTLLSLFRIPQILFSEQIYNENGSFPRHQPYFFESIKTSYYRAKSLVGLIKYFQWKSVSLVVNQRFLKDYLIFKHFAEMEDICLAVVLEHATSDEQDSSTDKNLMHRLGHGFGAVRVVVLFTDDKEMLKVIRGVGARKPSHYIWIDAMGTAESFTQELTRTTETILTLAPEYMFLEELKNHIVQLDCKKEKIEQDDKDGPAVLMDQCDMEVVSSQGVLDQTLKAFATKQSQDTRRRVAHRRAVEVQGIMNSVVKVGHAVSRYMETKCWDKTKEECFEAFSSHHLAEELQILVQKLFQGDSSHDNSENYFLKENMFSLVSIHGNSSGLPSRVVGTWDNKNWYINRAGILWPGKTSGTPDSTCEPTCPLGHIQIAEKGRKCCWSCQPCNYNQYITNTSTCADCVRGYWPSKDFRSCEFKLELAVLSCAGALSSVAAVLYSLVL
ncbi:metabotropic glutamate receptor 3-like isoform X1 [Actinia tenebrosa]|uniref:Metabotropic glutamate receptor 3-like isoform X1 n=1 Tax=Actinia tenebrosa TaxID=6105 RepID=A0A6P8HYR8_ACTTE|nr:metabotropic glutamate receptor 3-like isoform X1 [Actinia tenebrosa]